jgi:hypothetical protein
MARKATTIRILRDILNNGKNLQEDSEMELLIWVWILGGPAVAMVVMSYMMA